MITRPWRFAVALPTAVLLAGGAVALAAGPALADAPTGAPAASAPTAPASSAATTADIPAAPTDLSLTSPVTENDFDEVDVHDPRAITVAGTAPVGSKLQVTDEDGDVIAHLTTTATTFSIPVTFGADAPYEEDISVIGTSGTRQLTEWDFFVDFVDTPQSPSPTLTSPLGSVSYVAAPQPFLGFSNGFITVTGTGTPGLDVGIVTADEGSDISDPDNDDQYFDGTKVAANGTWSVQFTPDYGTVTLAAVQTVLNQKLEPTTVLSVPSNSATITVSLPKGTVDAPEITAPAYPDDATTQITFFDHTRAVVRSIDSAVVRTQAQKVARAHSRSTGASRSGHPVSTQSLALLKAAAAAKAHGATAKDGGDDSVDSQIASDGIQLAGRPSASHPGKLGFTVSGTGTPGDDIALYAGDGDAAVVYFSDLYPSFFETSRPTASLRLSRRSPRRSARR